MVSTETFKPTSYSEQQYLAFKRNVEVPVTLENIKIIATPILEARLNKIQRTSLNGREINEVLDEIYLIEDELESRKKAEASAEEK